MYTVQEVTSKEEWDVFVKKQEFSPFVQSSTYGNFYESLGEFSWRLGVYDADARLVAGSLVVSTHAKRGNFLYLPYGPVFSTSSKKCVDAFCMYVKSFAKEKGYDFIRMSPWFDNTKEGRELCKQYGFRPAPMHVLAENSWILDLSQSEEVLLAHMKKNHRNLIRRCERDGVTVTIQSKDADLSILHTMLDVTERRHNFTRFSREYINNEFSLFEKQNQAALFVGTLPDGRVDSAAIIMFYGNMAVYRHSGSLNLDKRHPSSYLVQWRVIQEAKRRGCRWYNFWGVNPQDQQDHPFSGIGHFKRGFGGFQKDIIHCQDYPVTMKYWLNYVVETIRAKKRGF